MRGICLLSCFLIFFAANSAAQDTAPASTSPSADVLTLDQAVTLALANNRTIKIAKLNSQIDEDAIAVVKTYRFPEVTVYALASQLLTPINFEFLKGSLGTLPGVGDVPAQDTKIHTALKPSFYGIMELKQPLSQLYKINLNVHLAKLNQQLDDEKVREQQQTVTSQVKQAYYQLLQTQSALDSSDENLKSDRELDRVTTQYVDQGTALKADSLAVKAQLAQEEYNNLNLSDSIASQKEQLNDLLGRDIRADFRVSPVSDATRLETNLEAAQTQALASRPELREARLQIKQAEFSRRITKSTYIPDVSLSFHNISLTNVQLLPSNVASVGVLVSWDPLDWGRRRHQLAENSKQIEQAQSAATETESQVLIDVNSKFRKLKESRLLLHAGEIARDAQKENLRVVMNQFEQKAALSKDVLQAQASLSGADHQYQQALLNFWTAKANFEKALGEE
jgi:outer membrane protein TolC